MKCETLTFSQSALRKYFPGSARKISEILFADMFAADREFMRFIDAVNCIMLDGK